MSRRSPVEYAAVQPDLWVDTEGRRFCDETIGFYETSVGNASARTKQWCNYSVFDSAVVERLARARHRQGAWHGPAARRAADEFETGTWTRLVQAGDPEVFAADSVWSLAEKIGVPPGNLQRPLSPSTTASAPNATTTCSPKTRSSYARSWDRGSTPSGHEPSAWVPWEASRINERCQALDAKGKIIPGLYAAGYDAGGMYGDSYPIRPSSGLSSAFAINSGPHCRRERRTNRRDTRMNGHTGQGDGQLRSRVPLGDAGVSGPRAGTGRHRRQASPWPRSAAPMCTSTRGTSADRAR